MAPSLSTASSASSVSAATKAAATPRFLHSSDSRLPRVSFPLFSAPPKLRLSSKPGQIGHTSIKYQPDASDPSLTKCRASTAEQNNGDSSEEASPPAALATEESISEFVTQVSTLIKLVDSRDIVELQLKQHDCELVIRKKEALPQPPSPASVVTMHPTSQQSFIPQAPASAPAPPPASSAPPSSTAPPPPPTSSPNSSLPTLKCPMAGTFYRCPGPGEPPFVKVGDKVKKGQVLCIIEAMKLMNEIEADQSGTIVDILIEDGKPVSIDVPLFVIQP